MPSYAYPHPEERPQGASRRTQSADATSNCDATEAQPARSKSRAAGIIATACPAACKAKKSRRVRAPGGQRPGMTTLVLIGHSHVSVVVDMLTRRGLPEG